MPATISRKTLIIGGGIAAVGLLVALIGMRVAGSGPAHVEDLPPLVTVAPPTIGPVASVVSINGTISA